MLWFIQLCYHDIDKSSDVLTEVTLKQGEPYLSTYNVKSL